MFKIKSTALFFAIFLPLTSYAAHEIDYIRSPDTRPCMLFQLKGVTDAGGTGSPWFALPFAHHAYKEMVSMLLAAKMSGKSIDVSTADRLAAGCGHAEVTVIGFR